MKFITPLLAMDASGIVDVAWLLYAVFVVGTAVYILVLLTQFVSAHRKIASAMEKIAQRGPDRGNP